MRIKFNTNILNLFFLSLLFSSSFYFGYKYSFFNADIHHYSVILETYLDKINGYKLFRDAKDQANQGKTLSFIEESEAGDLAFFNNDQGDIIHVGIILQNNHIIHASGKVRIDRIDHSGIYNNDLNMHTHSLRYIKKII